MRWNIATLAALQLQSVHVLSAAIPKPALVLVNDFSLATFGSQTRMGGGSSQTKRPENIGYEPTYFGFEDEHELEQARQAVSDAYTLAYTAIVHKVNDVFHNYFPPDHRGYVTELFSRIVDEHGHGQKVMQSIHVTKADMQERCDEAAKPLAYTNGTPPTITLCQSAFKFPSVTGPDAAHFDRLGHRVSYKMNTLATIILHELTHIWGIGQIVTGFPIKDHDSEGYGPYNTRHLAGVVKKENADNYAWFATVNYWTTRRGPFDPPHQQDQTDPRCENGVESGTCAVF